jgi:hypothetical protein
MIHFFFCGQGAAGPNERQLQIDSFLVRHVLLFAVVFFPSLPDWTKNTKFIRLWARFPFQRQAV